MSKFLNITLILSGLFFSVLNSSLADNNIPEESKSDSLEIIKPKDFFNKILVDGFVKVNLNNENHIFKSGYTKQRGKLISWTGFEEPEMRNQLSMISFDGRFSGNLFIDSKSYNVKLNEHGNLEVSFEKFIPEDYTCEQYQKSTFDNDLKGVKEYQNQKPKSPKQSTSNYGHMLQYDCKLRIMILGTHDVYVKKNYDVQHVENLASAFVNNLQAVINGSFINNVEVELAYFESTSYHQNSNSLSDMLIHMAGTADPHFTNIYNLIERYGIDITVLMGVFNDRGGSAFKIKACTGETFAVVSEERGLPQFSFAHEVGHLLGLRHNIDFDQPISYGHGYAFTASDESKWQSLMSIENNHTRLPYLSARPSSFTMMYEGVHYDFGNPQFSDSRQAWIDYQDNMMSHRPKTGERVLDNADINHWNSYGDIYHPVKISTSGTLLITPTFSYQIVAGEEIVLNNGFTVDASNSPPNTEIAFGITHPCGVPNNEVCGDQVPQNNKLSNINSDPEMEIRIIEFNKEVSIKNPQSKEISYQIISSLGQIIINGNSKKGEVKLSLNGFSSGVYEIRVITDSDKYVLKTSVL